MTLVMKVAVLLVINFALPSLGFEVIEVDGLEAAVFILALDFPQFDYSIACFRRVNPYPKHFSQVEG